MSYLSPVPHSLYHSSFPPLPPLPRGTRRLTAATPRTRTGASHIFCTNHVLRRATNEIILDALDTERFNRWTTPWPHSDSPIKYPELMRTTMEMSVKSQVVDQTGHRAEVDRLTASGCRWMMVQTWRPLKTVDKDPLALCDALTYDHSDWRHRISAPPLPGIGVLAHPEKEEKHKWYYVHEMKPNEIFVFKGGDSRMGEPGLTGYTGAHTSFILPGSEDKPPRESIESRFIAFWE